MSELLTLYVPADAKGMVALTREWLAARIVFVAGFVLAIAFFTYWTFSHTQPMADEMSAEYAAQGDGTEQVSGQTNQAGLAFCRLSIAIAESYGVLATTMRFGGGPGKTDVQGRYTCIALDQQQARYAVTAELVCRDLTKPDCVSLVTVAKDDGTKMYQRQGDATPPPDASAAAPADGSAPADQSGGADASAGTDQSGADQTAPSTPDNSGQPQQQP